MGGGGPLSSSHIVDSPGEKNQSQAGIAATATATATASKSKTSTLGSDQKPKSEARIINVGIKTSDL